LYLLLIMNLGRFVFRHHSVDERSVDVEHNSESGMPSGNGFSKLWPVPLAMGIVVAAFGLLAVLGLQKDKRLLLVAITVGGLALSGWPVLRHNGYAGRQADFLVTCFALCMGLMANLRSFTMEVLPTAAFLLSILLGSVGIHFLLCRLLGLPDGLFVATSAGGIMSPPFVPGICRATRHRSWIAFGVAAGLAGNATGTLLGLAVYEAAKGLAF
ncbi:MAG: hypothetical protein N2110_08370, partial [Flavobacteriales bacterium]|nr:hypothetical protein [Flavobacteriales bacterium]